MLKLIYYIVMLLMAAMVFVIPISAFVAIWCGNMWLKVALSSMVMFVLFWFLARLLNLIGIEKYGYKEWND